MKRMYLLFALPFLLFDLSVGQSWKEISGRFVTVEYLEGYEKTADSLLKLSELVVPRLAANFRLPLSDFDNNKTRVILTDAPDVSNGFAIGQTVVIYAVSSQFYSGWSADINWYQMVFAHEMVHNLTFRKLHRKLNFLGAGLALSVPRWYLEGLAQYYAEYWNAYRGDISLKNAILDGTFTYNHWVGGSDGRLLYAGGYAFVKYLAHTYGDSSLVNLMEFKQDGWLYDFGDAFKTVYKQSVSEMFPSFHRHLVMYYGGTYSQYDIATLPEPIPTVGFQVLQQLTLSIVDSTFIAVIQKDRRDGYLSLVKLKQEKGKRKVIQTYSDGIVTRFSLSPNLDWVVYGEPYIDNYHNQLKSNFQWSMVNLHTGKKELFLSDSRTRFATFISDQDLLYISVEHDSSRFYQFNIEKKITTPLLSTNMAVGNVSSYKNTLYFEAQLSNGQRELFELSSSNKLRRLTSDQTSDYSPYVINDSTLIFTRFIHEQPSIASLHLKTLNITLHLNDGYEYWVREYDRNANKIILQTSKAGQKNQLIAIPADELLSLKSISIHQPPTPYSGWTTKQPDAADVTYLADTTLQMSDGKSLYFPQGKMINLVSLVIPSIQTIGTFLWMEPLQRQLISVTFYLDFDNGKQNLITISHMLKMGNFDISTSLYHGFSAYSFVGSTYEESQQNIASIQVSKNLFPFHTGRHMVTVLGFGLFHERNYTTPALGHPEFYGLGTGLGYQFRLPTNLAGIIDQRFFKISGSTFKSFSSTFDFHISSVDFSFSHYLWLKNLGFNFNYSYVTVDGKTPPLYFVGIDQFYFLNLPRDYGYTKTIRGYEKDYFDQQLSWISTELRFLISEKTPFTLIFLPLENLVISGYYDLAIGRNSNKISSLGSELSSTSSGLVFGVGYAYIQDFTQPASKTDEKVFLRVSTNLSALGL